MKTTLGNIFDIGSGGTPSKAHAEYYGGGIPWVRTGDLKEEYLYSVEEHITEEGLKNSSAKMYEPGTVLIAMYGATIGATSILKINACTNQACAAFKPCDDVLPEYLYYFLMSKKKKFISDGVGGAQPNISAGYLTKVAIDVCSLGEQEKVITVLDKVNQIVSERKQEIIQLDNLIKARFVELFGDPGTNPKGYIQMTMKDAVDAGYIDKPLDGNHGEKHPKASEYVNEGVPFIMANNIVNGVVDYDNCSKITRERADKLDKGFSHDGDVLITHKGTIGRTAIVHTKLDYIVLTPQVTYYRPLHGITAEYLKGYFDTDFFQREMKKLAEAGGSTRAYVGITNQTQLQLVIPGMDLQNQYVEFVQQADKSKVVVQKALDETQTLFDSLMQEYFG